MKKLIMCEDPNELAIVKILLENNMLSFMKSIMENEHSNYMIQLKSTIKRIRVTTRMKGIWQIY